jgi:hypothetical protein
MHVSINTREKGSSSYVTRHEPLFVLHPAFGVYFGCSAGIALGLRRWPPAEPATYNPLSPEDVPHGMAGTASDLGPLQNLLPLRRPAGQEDRQNHQAQLRVETVGGGNSPSFWIRTSSAWAIIHSRDRHARTVASGHGRGPAGTPRER